MENTVNDQIKTRLELLRVVLKFTESFISELKDMPESMKVEFQLEKSYLDHTSNQIDLLVKWYEDGTLSRSQLKAKGEPLCVELSRRANVVEKLLSKTQEWLKVNSTQADV